MQHDENKSSDAVHEHNKQGSYFFFVKAELKHINNERKDIIKNCKICSDKQTVIGLITARTLVAFFINDCPAPATESMPIPLASFESIRSEQAQFK